MRGSGWLVMLMVATVGCGPREAAGPPAPAVPAAATSTAASGSTATAAVAPPASTIPAPIIWTPFSWLDAGFAVDLPAHASPLPHRRLTTPEGPVDFYYVEAVFPDGVQLRCLTLDNHRTDAKQTIDQRLDAARDGAVSSSGGKLLEETPIVVNGRPGRELKIELPNGRMVRQRLVLVGTRLQQWQAEATREQLDSPPISRFFETYRLIVREHEPGMRLP